MSDVQIPETSLQRIRTMYQQLDLVCQVVAEAIGIPSDTRRGLNLERGVFVLEDQSAPTNGVVQATEVPA